MLNSSNCSLIDNTSTRLKKKQQKLFNKPGDNLSEEKEQLKDLNILRRLSRK